MRGTRDVAALIRATLAKEDFRGLKARGRLIPDVLRARELLSLLKAGPAAAPAASSLAERLEAAVEQELRKVEALRASFGATANRAVESERTARTLATLTETLFKVRRLRGTGNDIASDDDDLPADADQFRINLALRIEVFVRSRADADVSERGEPADGDAAQP